MGETSGAGGRAGGRAGGQEAPFVARWCDKYGLSEGTATVLEEQGFSNVKHLDALTSGDIKDLNLPMSQRLILRGALLQFKENDMKYAERRSKKLGLPVEQTLFLTKSAVLELQHRPAQQPVTEAPTQEELEKRTELRRRLRRKKQRQQGGGSLAERILNQRHDMLTTQTESLMGGSEVSLMSTSSGDSSMSKASSSTLPAGHVTEPHLARHRETRSAADAHQRVANKDNDISKSIEEILTDEPEPTPPRSRSGRASGLSESGSRSNVKTPVAVSAASTQPRSEDEELITKMDAALERLLTEISDSVPDGTKVKDAKGDLQVAMDILEKEIVTDEERAMLAS